MSLWILAADNAAGDGAGSLSWLNAIFPFLIIGLLFYFLLMRPQKAEQARRQAMLAAIKKNDRVLTVGGIYGVVANVQKEGEEMTVTLKVDEGTNTKLRVTHSSIARILGDEPQSPQPSNS